MFCVSFFQSFCSKVFTVAVSLVLLVTSFFTFEHRIVKIGQYLNEVVTDSVL